MQTGACTAETWREGVGPSDWAGREGSGGANANGFAVVFGSGIATCRVHAKRRMSVYPRLNNRIMRYGFVVVGDNKRLR